jgi:trimeric autotransporter adhesin
MKPQIRINDMKTRLLPLREWVKRAPLSLHWVLLVIPAMLACFELLPTARAVLPPPPQEGRYPDGNTAVGTQALLDLTTGQDNTALGFRALTENTQGNLNTAIGSTALRNNRVGNRNTATGDAALFDNSVGNNNTANGYHALQSNKGNNQTAVGSGALEDTTTSSNNTALGYESGKNLSIGTNNIDVGNRGVAGETGTIRIGSSDQTRTFIAGIHGAVLTGGGAVIVNNLGQLGRAASSERFKQEIKPMDKASEALFALRPVTFRYKKEIDPQGMLQFGLVAEEVEMVNPDLVVRDSEGKPYTVRYDAVNAMLLNEFLKEHRKIAAVESRVAHLAASLKEEDSIIQTLSAQLELSKPGAQPVVNNQ